MARLLIHVEGETEETFVNDLLADHLYNFGYERRQRADNWERPVAGEKRRHSSVE